MTSYEKKLRRKENIAAGLMLSPAVILLIVTSIYPFFWLFRYVLYDYNGFSAYFTGFDNIKRAFTDVVFWKSVLHTFEYAIMKLIIVLPCSLILAVIIHNNIPGSKAFRLIFFLPTIISASIYALIFTFIFAVFKGPLNTVLQAMHIISAPIDWLGNAKFVMGSVVTVAVWGGIGNYMIYFLSGLSSISADIYESCMIDGANSRQQFFKITLPMLSPILKVILLLAVTTAFKDYESILVLTAGGPNNRSQVMFGYIYDLIFAQSSNPQIGYATVLSILAALIIGVITVLYQKLAKRLDDVV